MEKPAVLFVAGNSFFGSGEIVLIEYLTREKELPFHPVLVFPSPGPLLERTCEAGLESVLVKSRDYLTDFRSMLHQPFSWVFNLFSFIKISSIIRKRRVQLVVSLSFMNWTGALAARQEGIRHIWMIREIMTGGKSRPRFFWGKWLAGRLANDLSGTVILESEAAASLFQGKRGKDKARLILPGIDIDSFKTGYTGISAENKKHKNLTVFWGSRDSKRFRRLIDFLKYIRINWMKDNYPDSTIEIFFPGLPSVRISKFKKALSEENFDCQIRNEEIYFEPGLWKSSAVAIIIPGFDPLSRLVLEAGLAHVPVLLGRETPEELYINSQTGFIYDEEQPAEMSSLLRKLLDDEEFHQRIGNEAEKHVVNNFSMERWKREFEEIIQKYLI